MTGGLREWLVRSWKAPPEPAPAGAWLLDALAVLYGAGVALHRTRARRAPIPVVSVGSLWVGGTGKTPLAAMIARFAHEQSLQPAIVLRGYRGSTRGGVVRVPAPPGPGDAARFGDEGCLHARRADAAVYVAPDRLAGVRRAAEDGCRVAILDDGMQHRAIARDLEIVTLPASRPLGNGKLLPRGPLRERPGALRRAGVIVLAHAPAGEAPTRAADAPEGSRPGVLVLSWHGEIGVRALTGTPPERGGAVGLLCGVGRPGQFFRSVAACGYAIAWMQVFPDHHRYTQAEIDAVRARAAHDSVRWILTTEKDEVRLGPLVLGDEPGLAVADLQLIWNEPFAEEELRRRLQSLAAHP